MQRIGYELDGVASSPPVQSLKGLASGGIGKLRTKKCEDTECIVANVAGGRMCRLAMVDATD